MFDKLYSLLDTNDPDFITQGFELIESLELPAEEVQSILNDFFKRKQNVASNVILAELRKYSFWKKEGIRIKIPRIDLRKGLDIDDLVSLIPYLETQKLVAIDSTISSLPDKISVFSSLKTLVLKNAKLSVIPPQIENLVNLEYLYVQSNYLSEVPKFLDNLENLRLVSLLGQKITNVYTKKTPLILPWKQIQKLDLDPSVVVGISFHNSELYELPSEVERYYNTRHFFLGNNHFAKVPDILQSFEHLEGLYLFDNRNIKSLPDWLRSRSGIRVLQLSGMSSLKVPKWILTLRDLDLIRFPNGEPSWFTQHPRYQEINSSGYIMDIQ